VEAGSAQARPGAGPARRRPGPVQTGMLHRHGGLSLLMMGGGLSLPFRALVCAWHLVPSFSSGAAPSVGAALLVLTALPLLSSLDSAAPAATLRRSRGRVAGDVRGVAPPRWTRPRPRLHSEEAGDVRAAGDVLSSLDSAAPAATLRRRGRACSRGTARGYTGGGEGLPPPVGLGRARGFPLVWGEGGEAGKPMVWRLPAGLED
jgi:hypothetical protein